MNFKEGVRFYNCYVININTELNGKTLTYRMIIEPQDVYSNYISEWDMMENPENIKNKSIYNMQWN